MLSGFLLMLGLSLQSQAQSKPHFNHTTIYVTDLDPRYRILFKVMMLEPFPNHSTITAMLVPNWRTQQLHVVSGAKEDIPHDVNIHLAFTVSSLPDFMKHLENWELNMEISLAKPNKIAIRPDKVEQIYLQDPDGYWIEVDNDKF